MELGNKYIFDWPMLESGDRNIVKVRRKLQLCVSGSVAYIVKDWNYAKLLQLPEIWHTSIMNSKMTLKLHYIQGNPSNLK
jgi:hypothetical protein